MIDYILLVGVVIVGFTCMKLINEVDKLKYYSRRTNNKVRFLEQKINGR